MGLFFRHILFIVYFLSFILVFIRDIHEVVNMNYAHFYWISITGYIKVTLWKGQLDQTPMSRLSDLWNVHGWHRVMGKRPLLAYSRNAGRWYELLQIIEKLSSHTSRFICNLLGMHAVERSYPRPLVGRLFYRLCLRGLSYRDKDTSGASREYGAVYQAEHAAKRECGYFCTASIT